MAIPASQDATWAPFFQSRGVNNVARPLLNVLFDEGQKDIVILDPLRLTTRALALLKAAMRIIVRPERVHWMQTMADWEIHGQMFTNCSCAYGCPCQFNALPTHGYCRAVVFVQIESGHFDGTKLDGLNFAFAVAWPGAVHQGHGKMQPIIDERGDASQREALLSILNGKGSDPMKTIFGIYTAMCETISEPVHTRISIDLDMETRIAKCEAKGIATGRGEPIKNPVTGVEHRASIVLPNGTEYGVAEIGRAWSESFGTVEMTLADTHGQWCEAHMNQHGRIH